MANLAIQGHPTRGSEVIEILKMLGGNNVHKLTGNTSGAYYIIEGFEREIRIGEYIFGNEDICFFTLEEFEENFPYKVGDKVNYVKYNDEYPNVYTIQNMRWTGATIEYLLDSSGFGALTKDLQPYKEETMEEKTYPPYMDYDVKTMKKEILPYFLTVYDSEENKHEIVATDGYEIKEENGKYYAVKKKPQYPKTYKECCDVLGLNTMGNDAQGYKADLIIRFQELLIARDAYWKIAGEQMGLNEPWKPDWKNDEQGRYMIMVYENKLHKDMSIVGTNFILVFPTEEMRDVFCENFNDLIEQCKELL